ncbi:MAG: DGQHR domain-containing protein [Candidatus Bathyarchaeia archaeon]
MASTDPGITFENQIREFLISVGFSDVPSPRSGREGTFVLGSQEIDAFGRDGDLYVVVDAKTKSSVGRRGRNVRNYLSIINGYRSEVIKNIKARYEREYGFRDVIFVFWTKDIKIDEEHRIRAKELNIALRDDFDLLYYNQAYNMLGNRDIVRNGFLKDLSLQLPDFKPFREGHCINAKAICTKIGAVTLYTLPMQVNYLLKFAYVFRVETNSILGESYQRLLQEKKLKKIKEYIRTDGYFPNNLIVTSEEQLKFTPEEGEKSDASIILGTLYLPDKPCYLEILDGQHRLYGYSSLSDRQNHYIWVTIIECLREVERAKLFVTINKTQTPVPPAILWDLFTTTEPGSIRGKIAAFVYKLNEIGPLKDLISLPRIRSSIAYLSFPNLCITLYTRTNLFSQYGSEESFINIIRSYFEAILSDSVLRKDWERSTKSRGKKGFLCTNNSMSVLLRLLAKVLKKKGLPRNDEIQSWKDSLKEWVIIPLKKYLNENKGEDKEDPYKELRKLTSEKARKDAANKIWEKSPLRSLQPRPRRRAR